MALTSTTLAAAAAATDRTFLLTSATGWSAGMFAKINGEFVYVQAITGTSATVQRGRWGTNAQVHGILSRISVGNAEDFPVRPKKRHYTYGADGAILAYPGWHKFNKAGAVAGTLAAPTADMEGEEFEFIAQAAQANTITLDSGYWNGATNTVATFGGAIGDAFKAIVVGGSYCIVFSKNITLS
jgi:hypothetical protein